MNFDFAQECWYEAKFCAKHYDSLVYWRDNRIDPEWYACYQMGNEL